MDQISARQKPAAKTSLTESTFLVSGPGDGPPSAADRDAHHVDVATLAGLAQREGSG